MTAMSRWFLFGLLSLCTPLAWADPSLPAPSTTEPSVILNSQINSGDTAWMLASMALVLRSEERRVGKECRSRWSPYH